MKLLIVESPNKIAKIKSYISSDWQIAASVGHIRDLPKNEIGVTGPKYLPQYVASDKSKLTIAKLKRLAQDAEVIYLATDPDREGEAIAWHLQQVLGKEKHCVRVTFNEITQSAIQKALQSPREVDYCLFLAQQGRRVLDRLFGYKVSPVLGEKLGKRGLSAGRVQSVALRLVVEREQAIHNFTKTDHFGVRLDFNSSGETGATGKCTWSARWDSKALVTEDNPYITERSAAQQVIDVIKDGVIVKSFEEKIQQRKPPAPLITSTLQQAAANVLKMSVNKTMTAAQLLFEAGLITYHRTDNPNLSEEATTALWSFLQKAGQEEHIPEQPHHWKAKDAQEAHEAIRPTNFAVRDANTGNEEADLLYKLIRRTAIACQMKAAVYKVRNVVLLSSQTIAFKNVPNPQEIPAQFSATGRELLYPGWLVVAEDDYTNEEKEESQLLPVLIEGVTLHPTKSEILALKTKPPIRYSETALVKALEREGIGRPSTYASIINTLLKRDYVRLEKRKFNPTETGEAIVKALKDQFSFMEVSYTRDMESHLDAIAQGKANYQVIVAQYDNALDQQLTAFESDENISTLPNTTPNIPCPECEKGHLRRIKGKNSYFWGCSNYQNGCKCTRPDNKGKPGTPPEPKSTAHPCPACKHGYLQRRLGKKKGTYWWGCDRYPDCKHTMFDNDGVPIEKNASNENNYRCGACGGQLKIRQGKKGKFWGCGNYPDCKHTEQDVNGKPQSL